MPKSKKEYKLENYTIVGDGIWVSRKELERLYKAYNAYKSNYSALHINDLLYKIREGKKQQKQQEL